MNGILCEWSMYMLFLIDNTSFCFLWHSGKERLWNYMLQWRTGFVLTFLDNTNLWQRSFLIKNTSYKKIHKYCNNVIDVTCLILTKYDNRLLLENSTEEEAEVKPKKTVERTIYTDENKIAGVIVHRADKLRTNFLLQHPLVRVHIVDVDTGQPLTKHDKWEHTIRSHVVWCAVWFVLDVGVEHFKYYWWLCSLWVWQYGYSVPCFIWHTGDRYYNELESKY